MYDLDKVGGVQVVMKRLLEAGVCFMERSIDSYW